MELNEYYKEAYLTCGNIRDDYVFTGCSLDFVNEAKRYLAGHLGYIKYANVNNLLEKIFYIEK